MQNFFLLQFLIAFTSRSLMGCSAQEKPPIKPCGTPKYTDWFNFPFGLDGYFDYQSAMACAKEQETPVLLLFTGHGICSHRAFLSTVMDDPELVKFIGQEFIPVALYVDDKTELPEDEWVTANERVQKTIGSQNMWRQIDQFNSNVQPYWVILDHYGNVMVDPISYTIDLNEIRTFFHQGVETFNAIHSDKFEND